MLCGSESISFFFPFTINKIMKKRTYYVRFEEFTNASEMEINRNRSTTNKKKQLRVENMNCVECVDFVVYIENHLKNQWNEM